MAESDFWGKFFSGRNYLKLPEIAAFADFHWIFSLYFVVFHTKTLLSTIPTIKNVSNVNKTDFWSRNSVKIARTADFRRKTVYLEFLELYFIFFHEILHTDAKWQCLFPMIFCTKMLINNAQNMVEFDF